MTDSTVSRLPTTQAARPPATTHTFADLERMAKAVAASKLFGMKTPEEALSLMLLADAEGRHPALAARDFHIVEGRPALKADAMLARFQEAGGRVEWKALTDDRVAAVFSHPHGGSVEIAWTMDTARQAGLTGRQNWQKYPRAMLRSRVISEGVRTVLPGVIVGTYTPEELRDGDVEIRDVTTPETAAAPVDPAPAPASPAEVTDAEVIETSGLTDSQRADHLAAIEAAADKPSLVRAYNTAYRAAGAAKDSAAVAAFKAARDARLAALGA